MIQIFFLCIDSILDFFFPRQAKVFYECIFTFLNRAAAAVKIVADVSMMEIGERLSGPACTLSKNATIRNSTRHWTLPPIPAMPILN